MIPPKVSIITPTFNRPHFLNKLLSCVKSQTYPNIEWLIFDDSPSENQFFAQLPIDRVKYIWSERRLSVGMKRNFLLNQSDGDIIVHFDDDDYYAPNYIAERVSHLTRTDADISLLNGFFVYHLDLFQFGYYETFLKQGPAYRFGQRGIEGTDLARENIPYIHLCYGFSYVYRHALFDSIQFEDADIFEDRDFIMKRGELLNVQFFTDTQGLTFHNAHRHSSSVCYPQYLIPPFLIVDKFSVAFAYLRELPERQ